MKRSIDWMRAAGIRPSEITPRGHYRSRRRLLGESLSLAAAGVAGAAAADAAPGAPAPRYEGVVARSGPQFLEEKVAAARPDSTPDSITPYEYASQYNNFYEFGTDKDDPFENAQGFVTDPWSVQVDGEVGKPGTYTLEDILRPHALEERIYRLRCVEAWSMVIPWVGFPVGSLLSRFEPTANAKFVEFTTLLDPERMPEQRSRVSAIKYPYVEGLRLDEAMHPLSLFAVGMYGEVLPPQNGAPLRLVVPWKYGFKSIKSIVRIRLTERQPQTTWNRSAAHEYGFYANVNPDVDHPRWSQKRERRLPGSLFSRNTIDTLPFNGYGDAVASLYAGMDLRRYF
jgi:sulfoxide reductase catalytic subunit YedY